MSSSCSNNFHTYQREFKYGSLIIKRLESGVSKNRPASFSIFCLWGGGRRLKDRQLVKNHQGPSDNEHCVRKGDVTVNQHFPFLPPGPHVAHQRSRTWRATAWRTAATRRATRPTANMTSREDTMLTRLSMTCWTWPSPPMFASCQTKVRTYLPVVMCAGCARQEVWRMLFPLSR